jgi:hypothetical protein
VDQASASALASNSQFGGFNSRLGRQKSRLDRDGELGRKGLICLAVSGAKTALAGQNRKNSRYYVAPWQTEILALGIWGWGAAAHLAHALSCNAYMAECIRKAAAIGVERQLAAGRGVAIGDETAASPHGTKPRSSRP